MHSRTRKLEFGAKTRNAIKERDGGKCLFCGLLYHMPKDRNAYGCGIFDIMHYVPRSQGGLGVEQNGVLGCRYHHQMMDNGNNGLRQEMLSMLRGYLCGIYPEWSEDALVYRKGAGDAVFRSNQ